HLVRVGESEARQEGLQIDVEQLVQPVLVSYVARVFLVVAERVVGVKLGAELWTEERRQLVISVIRAIGEVPLQRGLVDPSYELHQVPPRAPEASRAAHGEPPFADVSGRVPNGAGQKIRGTRELRGE